MTRQIERIAVDPGGAGVLVSERTLCEQAAEA
jgi:hypothetical protein